jgi:hypothetical protein
VKGLRIAQQLLWANRWLWLLLVLWPWGMAALLLLSGPHPPIDDVEAALQQEAIYGLALVAFTGGALLGNEQRSRRIMLVLSRAVSRRQYLGALWLTAVLPLLAYIVDLELTGLLLRAPASVQSQMLCALLLLGLITASVAVLCSLVLPGVVSGMLSLAIVSLPLALPEGTQVALTRLLQVLLSGPATEQVRLLFAAGTAEALLLSLGIFEAAARIFERRDLRLKSE